MDDVGRRPDPDHRGVADIHAAAIYSAHPHEGIVAGPSRGDTQTVIGNPVEAGYRLAISKLSIITPSVYSPVGN